MLRHEIGLKSEGREAFIFFGIKTRFAEFHCLRSFPERKNSFIASVTSVPMTDQEAVKNSAEYPSGPPVLFLGREKKASLISVSENLFWKPVPDHPST